mmetsp:Transcript_37090/g.60202  ORF Transcript_37090/g.60202 Transcript_37090/m.60202 type:complete len:231 (+) Transcript_37090:734-1426(+)
MNETEFSALVRTASGRSCLVELGRLDALSWIREEGDGEAKLMRKRAAPPPDQRRAKGEVHGAAKMNRRRRRRRRRKRGGGRGGGGRGKRLFPRIDDVIQNCTADWEPNGCNDDNNGSNKARGVFHLCVCTSVLQYLPEKELEEFVKALSSRVFYLYLTVPTTKEYSRQVGELHFHDKYAIQRSRKYYQKVLSRYFTFLSSRILESKRFFDDSNTPFTDLLFRFGTPSSAD